MEGRSLLKIQEKKDIDILLGKITLNVYFLSIFIWTAGFKYSVWLGVLALFFKSRRKKLETGPKWIGNLNLVIFFGTILTDLLNYNKGINFSSFDKYNIFIMYFVLINFIENEKEVKYYLKLTLVSFVISIFGTIPSIKILLNNSNYRIHSFYDVMRYSHLLGAYIPILLGMIFFLGNKKIYKIICTLLLIISIILLIFTKTRGAILASFIGLILYILYVIFIEKKIKIAIITLFILSSTVLLLPNRYTNPLIHRFKYSENSDNIRKVLWKGALQGVNDNPVFGVGFKGVHNELEKIFIANGDKEYLESRFGKYYGDVHNSYLALLVRHGYLIGGIAILFMFFLPVYFLLNIFKVEEKYKYLYLGFLASMASFLISGLTDDVLSVKTGNIFIISFSFTTIILDKLNKKKEKVLEEN